MIVEGLVLIASGENPRNLRISSGVTRTSLYDGGRDHAKKKAEEHVNHERWMVSTRTSYLLFAFRHDVFDFCGEHGKVQGAIESLTAAFQDPNRSLEPIQIGELVRSPADDPGKFCAERPTRQRPVEIRQLAELAGVEQEALQRAANSSTNSGESKPLEEMMIGAISIQRSEYWIEVEMNAEVLFDSGSSDLYPSVVPILMISGRR